MRRVWLIVGAGAFALFLYWTALPGDLAVGRDGDVGLAGTYAVNGVDPTGAEYSGTAVIVATDTSSDYDIEWIITNAIQRGSGTVDGSTFEARWTATSSVGDGSGRVVYRIQADGRLVGERFIDGIDESGPEELFPEP